MIRRILILIVKDFRIFLSDPVAIGLGLIVPMVMILVFGIVFGGVYSHGIGEFTVLAVNEDQGPAGRRLLRALDDLDEINIVEHLRGDSLALDSATARQRVEDGKNSVALIGPTDFSAGLKAGEKIKPPVIKSGAYILAWLTRRIRLAVRHGVVGLGIAAAGV